MAMATARITASEAVATGPAAVLRARQLIGANHNAKPARSCSRINRRAAGTGPPPHRQSLLLPFPGTSPGRLPPPPPVFLPKSAQDNEKEQVDGISCAKE